MVEKRGLADTKRLVGWGWTEAVDGEQALILKEGECYPPPPHFKHKNDQLEGGTEGGSKPQYRAQLKQLRQLRKLSPAQKKLVHNRQRAAPQLTLATLLVLSCKMELWGWGSAEHSCQQIFFLYGAIMDGSAPGIRCHFVGASK